MFLSLPKIPLLSIVNAFPHFVCWGKVAAWLGRVNSASQEGQPQERPSQRFRTGTKVWQRQNRKSGGRITWNWEKTKRFYKECRQVKRKKIKDAGSLGLLKQNKAKQKTPCFWFKKKKKRWGGKIETQVTLLIHLLRNVHSSETVISNGKSLYFPLLTGGY